MSEVQRDPSVRPAETERGARPTPEEHQDYLEWARREVSERFALAMPFGVAFGLAATMLSWFARRPPLGSWPALALLATTALLVASVPLSALRALARRPHLVVLVFSPVSGLAAGLFTAQMGGWSTLGGGVVLVTWIYTSALVPLRLWQKAANIVAQLATYVPVLVILVPPAGVTSALFAVFLGIAAVMALFAAAERDRADEAAFVAQRRLAVARRQLADQRDVLAAERATLEERVGLEVQKNLSSAVDEAALESRLMESVASRAHAIAREVERASRPVGSWGSTLAAGSVVAGRYRVERAILTGAYETVYQARDVQTGERRLVTVVRTDPGGDGDALAAELRAAARVTHPAIVALGEVRLLPDGRPCAISPPVDGLPFGRCMSRARLPAASGARLFARVADALAEVHAAGVVHGGLDPQRIVVTAESPPMRILSLGVPSAWRRAQDEPPSPDSDPALESPAYLAPEQLRGAPAEAPVDVYALGAVLFHAIAGRHPFLAETPSELAAMALEPASLGRFVPDAPPALVTLLARMLDHDASRRPAMAVVASTLGEIADAAGAPAAGEVAAVVLAAEALWSTQVGG